ncbi:MAG TPA: hypothetical protein VF013_09520 [Candidatus Limnocylindria bacterium]
MAYPPTTIDSSAQAQARTGADAVRIPTRPALRRRSWRPSRPLALLMLAGIFGVALLAPVPAIPNTARAEVVSRVEQRLPGWQIVHTLASWEGAWTVVARCGSRQVGFQMVPGHGLRPQDAWIHPEDQYSRSRLASVSDDRNYLVWYDGELTAPRLSCRTELARTDAERHHSGGGGHLVD